ncbi:MAG: 2-amino-4-hydroxy-6-hydroxymethyldihydropteridine diphosphokinase [Prevotella sp.]|nr:2-amino-4-hydroxy-6-hydroxymethyldihydropteridine diphosphokinase [Prevotella sp.]
MAKHRTILVLGSNYDPKRNLMTARRALEKVMDMEFTTSALWSDPTEGYGPQYLNCLVVGYTKHTLPTFCRALKYVERECGDKRAERTINHVHIDIDVLLYDDIKCHEADWEHAYIKNLLRLLPK